jgi:manganese transport protein
MKLVKILESLLPGLFLVGFTIGTGSVTAMVKAGADHGMTLLWALLLSSIVSYILFDSFGRLTIFSGQTALHAIRTHLHPGIALFFLVALVINVSASVMGVMGILSGVLSEWSLTWNRFAIPPIVWGIVLSVIIFVVLMNGTVKALEVLLASLAGIMGVCFLANAATMLPPISEILRGLVPHIPQATAESGARSGYLVAASMVGTTVAPIVLMMRSILVHEKNWSPGELKIQKRDAVVSCVAVFIISTAIMFSAAGTLHKSGIRLNHVREMIPLLEPIAGSVAILIFVLGVVAAGLSSQFPNVVSVSWLRHDFRGEPVKISGYPDRFIILVMCLVGLVVPVFQSRPVWVMLASQAIGAIILPTTIVCLAYLLNMREVMGDAVNTIQENVVLAVVAIFSLVMAGVGIYGLFF